ncbi:MAG: ParM/StbA family protein [Candidatus Heimdallarchaeota archaeon]|nr:ParM/StbA family protein [Candidatus Heimdallarchaeota archaeon]MCK4290149.1 ParM/StbA family protein [Candidatus Heimdallarchaeota archaeon]
MSKKVLRSVGIDLGTSTIKISSNNGSDLKRIPSIIGDPNPGWTGMTLDKSLENNLVLEEGGQTFFVGELARLQSEIKRALASEGKMKSIKDAVMAIKAALSLFIKGDGEQILIATGVPVATSQDEMSTLSKGLSEEMELNVRNDATGETHSYNINVQKCLVLPEPYGSYYQILKTSGESRAVDAIIVDIGHGSTDILTVYQGRLMRTASGSLEEAVDTLTTRMARTLQEKTGKIIRPFDLMKTIEKNLKAVMVGGQQYDVSEVKEYYTQSISEIIIDETSRLLGTLPPDAWIERVILTGGGAYVFGDTLKEMMWKENIVKSPEEVVVPDNPVMCNAMGFELIAQSRMKQEAKNK